MTTHGPLQAASCLLALCTTLALGGCTQAQREGTDPAECSDGLDNDIDGFIDCADQDCLSSTVCLGDDDDSVGDDDDSTSDDDDTTADDDDSAGPTTPACEPALALESASTFPLGLVVLTATGGTGEYSFSLVENNSGALVNALSGSYIAGITDSVIDTVEVVDAGCEGSAQGQIEVNPILQVLPQNIEVLPAQAFTFQVVGGSGSYSCTLQASSAGGALDESTCSYQAGTVEGSDAVLFVDLATGHEELAWIEVHNEAAPVAEPGQVVLSLGSNQSLTVRGGSGHWDIQADTSGIIDASGDTLTSLASGHTELTITDQFTSLSTQLAVHVVEAQQAPLTVSGEAVAEGHALSTDVNGDGHIDAILSSPGASHGSYRGGLVMLWLGDGDGLDPIPARTWSSTTWEDYIGRGLALGDFQGDGYQDLVIGSPYKDGIGGYNSGVVEVYDGGSGTLFSAEPGFTSSGDHGSDYYGQSVAACDVNGDGFDDLLVGSYQDEDRTQLVTYTNQGAIHLYLGSATGLSTEAYDIRYGMVPDANGWLPEENVKLGYTLAAGDVNGDGYCDVVGGAYPYSGNDGAVFVYLGSGTGLSAEPVAAWTGETSTNNGGDHFGRHLAVGDVSGDDKADILVGEWAYDTPGISSANHGAAWLFLGRDFASAGAVTSFADTDTADWSLLGDSGYDYTGHEVEIGDMDGVPPLDLIISSVGGEVSGGTNNTGVVQIFHGVTGGLPATTPDLEFAGTANGDWFGMYVAPLGDANGDGSADLFVHAHRDPTLGVRSGLPRFVPGAALLGDDDDSAGEEPQPQALDFFASSAGQFMGWSAAFVGDVNSDGFEDLVVGARGVDKQSSPVNSGAAWLYLGTASGVESQPALSLMDYERNSGFDEFGASVTRAGDFNGDGIDDFAVSARYEDRPTSFSSAYANSSQCGANRNNSGAVYIFLGVSSGLPSTEPAFAYYGSYSNNRIEMLSGGFDFNGDLYDDLIVGYPQYDGSAGSDTGGVAVILGRPEDSSGTWLLCEPDIGFSYDGSGVGDDLGKGVAVLGDLDNDGCGEFAVGAPDADLEGFNNQGAVLLFWGAGGAGCPMQVEYSVMLAYDSNARAGYSLGSGADVDGDGFNDLAIGGYTVSESGNTVGAAWIATSDHLSSLPSELSVTGQPPTIFSPLVANEGNFYVRGEVHNEQFGRAVALVPNLSNDGRAGLMVGGPLGKPSGTELSGGARVYEFEINSSVDYGIIPTAVASFGGETFAPDSRLGEQVGATSSGGQAYGVVGGYRSDALSVDNGAAYVFPISP